MIYPGPEDPNQRCLCCDKTGDNCVCGPDVFEERGDQLPPVDAPTANQVQHGGTHYKSQAVQPWDYIVSNGLGFLEGNAVKYLSRFRQKNGVEDLRKAIHYIQKLIEIEEAAAASPPGKIHDAEK